MNELILDLGITYLLHLLKKVIPNNLAARNKYKKMALKVFRAIGDAYGEDNDFDL